MSKVKLISVDLAKDVFQVAGFTDRLKEVFNRQIIFLTCLSVFV